MRWHGVKKIIFKAYLILIKYFLAYIGRVIHLQWFIRNSRKKNVCKLLYASLTPIFCLKNKKMMYCSDVLDLQILIVMFFGEGGLCLPQIFTAV